jgi:hypothetical protein
MQLTENFWLSEFIKSPYAERMGIDNTPPESIIPKLTLLCEKILQPLRDFFDKTVTVNSGYRCKELNTVIGGSASSQHMQGEAADIEIYGVSTYEVAKWIADNCDFDQLILECYQPEDINSGWTHISYKETENRKQILTKLKNEKNSYRVGFYINS